MSERGSDRVRRIEENDKENYYKKYVKKMNVNVVFYKSIFLVTYNENKEEFLYEEYKNILMTRGMVLDNNNLVNDYIKQIVDVAGVATIKAYIFEIAVKYLCLAVIICLAMAAIYYL